MVRTPFYILRFHSSPTVLRFIFGLFLLRFCFFVFFVCIYSYLIVFKKKFQKLFLFRLTLFLFGFWFFFFFLFLLFCLRGILFPFTFYSTPFPLLPSSAYSIIWFVQD